jgi:DNA-binding NarL/FixJ family response regulator
VRIVVADDEPDVRFLLRLQLQLAGFEVVGEAGSGDDAVTVCATTKPDAIVLDLLMPRGTGFEAIPLLREHQPDLHIVAYTAVAGQFVRDEMARLGAVLVLKTGDVEPVVDALRRTPAPRT